MLPGVLSAAAHWTAVPAIAAVIVTALTVNVPGEL
jgi:hypothetical protein